MKMISDYMHPNMKHHFKKFRDTDEMDNFLAIIAVILASLIQVVTAVLGHFGLDQLIFRAAESILHISTMIGQISLQVN